MQSLFVTFNNHGLLKIVRGIYGPLYTVPPVVQTMTLADSTERASQIGGSYRSTRRNETTYQKVGYNLLSPPVTVSAYNNGHLMIKKGVGSQERDLVKTDPLIYKQTNGLDDAVTFRKNGNEMNMFIGNRPYQVLLFLL
jgi:hypothetical protein